MKDEWPTKEKDIHTAHKIMDEYAKTNNNEVGLFELVLDKEAKRMDYRIADWVTRLAKHFYAVYGIIQGDFITRQIISNCLINGQTLH